MNLGHSGTQKFCSVAGHENSWSQLLNAYADADENKNAFNTATYYVKLNQCNKSTPTQTTQNKVIFNL